MRPRRTCGSRRLGTSRAQRRPIENPFASARWIPGSFQVMGGIIPQAPVDWYGLAEVQFNFGAFEHHREDDLFVKAQADETAHAAYETT